MDIREIEFRRWSQNGEDGLIEWLSEGIKEPTNTFLEIGCGTGRQNNSRYLAENGWSGTCVDAKRMWVKRYRNICQKFDLDIRVICRTVGKRNVKDLSALKVDVFSLDIDSCDWHVFQVMLKRGFRPTIAVVEYQSAFGLRPITVLWRGKFTKSAYSGAGVMAWRNLLEPQGYRFVTVDSAGVNAFFVREEGYDLSRLDGVAWLEWQDCASFADKYGPASKRFARIERKPFLWCDRKESA